MSTTPTDDDDERTRIPDRGAVRGPASARDADAATGYNALPVGTRLAEFEIVDLVGEGGFGIVYLVYDHSLHRRVALKEYMPSSFAHRVGETTVAVKSDRHSETFAAGLRSFINEARLLAQFDHPSLLKVHRFWEANGTGYMVMPFYEGLTLKQSLGEHDTAPSEKWLRNLLSQLLDAVEVLHRARPPCVHRDISPDNILLLKDGRPLLLDFGAARHVISDMAQALTVMLKPGYAPIEQYAEEPSLKQGPWTDIYALAAVVYFAIMGRAPIPSVSRLVSDSMVPLGKAAAGRYSPAFLHAIDTALSVRPENRPRDIDEFRQLLGMSEPAAAPPIRFEQSDASEPAPVAAAAAPRRRMGPAVIGGILVLAILGGAVWWGMTEREKILSAASKAPAAPAPVEIPPAVPPAPVPGPARMAPSPVDAGTAAGQPPARPLERTYDPLKALAEVYEARDPQHQVTVALERAQVNFRNNEKIKFSVASSKPGFVYVLESGIDTDGKYAVLLVFPTAYARDNRIRPDVPLPIPPLDAGGPAGTDHFLVIVADSERDFTAAGLRKTQGYADFPRAVAAQRYKSHTGPTPFFAGKAKCAAGAPECSDAYGAEQFTVEEVDR